MGRPYGPGEGIQSALECIRARLNAFLQVWDPETEDWVLLSNLVDHSGASYPDNEGKIIMLLAGIQNETSIGPPARTVPIPPAPGSENVRHGVVSPPVYINLLVLFIANSLGKKYADGLGMISRTISFFQQNPYFTHDTLPDLDPDVEKLSLELVNLDFMQGSYLVGMLGGKYLPMVLYRVRMLSFRSDQVTAVVPAARNLKTSGAPDPTS